MTERKSITIYTDGACEGNPGPGGYGVVLLYGSSRKELSGGFRRTTNNRMELYAAICGLEALKEPCEVILHSDSEYLVKAINLGWARRWKANRWMRNKKDPAQNADLWERLLGLCDIHNVQCEWVRGHAGNRENERCDRLSVAAIHGGDLQEDVGFEER